MCTDACNFQNNDKNPNRNAIKGSVGLNLSLDKKSKIDIQPELQTGADHKTRSLDKSQDLLYKKLTPEQSPVVQHNPYGDRAISEQPTFKSTVGLAYKF
jgi:hypothetical protein